ncbi:MAG: response regulator [Lachnospiraceae bacterium]|nr:response regulator [Candidatus Colinaster scatohippi]
MNSYSFGALVAMLLIFLGTIALAIGIRTYKENRKSEAGRRMLFVFLSVFVWNVGYGWMSMCYDDDFAYVPRAVALLAVFAYMAYMILYVSAISDFNRKPLAVFRCIYIGISAIAWLLVIQKSAVSFVRTDWGYWYTSSMSFARMLQFAIILLAIVVYYIVLGTWKRRIILQREKALIRRFELFGPVMVIGYAVDTLIPSITGMAAVPGSAIAAFVSALILYNISVKYRAMGASSQNVSEYVFNEVKVPVIVTDNNGRIVLSNAAAAVYFDKSESEIRKERIVDLVRMEVESTSDICTVINRDLFCRLDSSDVVDEYGDVIYKIVFVTDMTDAIRTMELMENSRKVAEEANKSKSDFLANMSHEIRTPMNAIIGITDILLRDSKMGEEEKERLLNIKDASDGLLAIINDILDISKIESGKYELANEKYDIPSLINNVTNIISVKLLETAVELDVDVDDDIPVELYGDETKVRQVILNVLGNAVKFTKKGTIGIRAYCEKNEYECRLMFDISDTGIGIKEEHLDDIFGEFSQVDTRKNREIQGTGLGLAISKKLANLMGGDITVESTYMEGSTFHIVIVQKMSGSTVIGEDIANALKNKEYKRKTQKSELAIEQKTDKRILVVDDMPVNILVAKGLLKPYGVAVDEATSGQEAIDKIKANDYDLVFMDHMMPEMDGADATGIIRSLPDKKYKDLVIVALTANSIADAKELLLNCGMNDFLAKPINKSELNEIMNKWL